MDSDKRKFILLALIVISAVIIGLIIYFLVYYSYSSRPKNSSVLIEQPTVVTPRITNVPANQPNESVVPTPSQAADLVQEDALQVAKTFVERYGTYANQGGQDQFSDLNLFVTDKMKLWLADDTKSLLAGLKNYETSYVVVTKAVSARMLSLDQAGGRAQAMVSTKQSRQSGDEAPSVAYKDIQVDLVKAGKRWRVDAAAWQ